MSNKSEKHEFALYWPMFSKNHYSVRTTVTIADAHLYHRITKILRLKKDDHLILFDRQYNFSAILTDVDQNKVNVEVVNLQKNTILKPTIIFLLPLLKRDAFEQAIYSLVELGASEIRLITTQKTQRKWGGQKEMDRLEKVMIAAAEQSKNFAFPVLHQPINFEHAVKNVNDDSAYKIFFDSQGHESFEIMQKLRKEMPENIILLIGAEGDLSQQEKVMIENTFLFCKLTPTILRAQQAVTVSLGLMRSLL